MSSGSGPDLKRLYFDMSPMPLWLFDFSRIMAYVAERGTNEIDAGDAAELVSLAVALDANEAALRLYEASDKETLFRSLPSLIPPEAFSDLIACTVALSEGKDDFEIETLNHTCAGKPLMVRIRFSAMKQESGYDFENTLLTVVDMTELRQAEERMKLLSLLPEANPDSVVIMDCEARIRYLNPSAMELLKDRGFSRTEEIFKVLPKDYARAVCRICDRVEPLRLNHENDGKHYVIKIRPFPDENRCLTVLSDVTEIRKAKEDRELFFEAMNSSMHAMLLTDLNGVILHVNRAFVAMYGYEESEVIGKKPNILNPGKAAYFNLGYSENHYERLFADLWAAIKDPEKGSWQGVVVNRSKQGRFVWVNLTINAVRCEEGNITNFIAIPVDITMSRSEEIEKRFQCYKTIAAVAEMRDTDTGNHMQRVGIFSRILAESLNQSKKFCADLELFSPLHDIGKVGITDTILLAKRSLTVGEHEYMKSHTVLGYQILKDKPELEIAALLSRHHHERFDGTGYPDGLSGERIPLCARITAVSDVYDALRSERPYKPAWSHEATVGEIRGYAGTQFDPALIDRFLRQEHIFKSVYDELKD